MTVISSRYGRQRSASRHVRAALALVLLTAALLVSACGMNAQTLKPYTPAQGVNFDVGDQSDPTSVIHVRNLLIISRTTGSGIVSASMVTTGTDTLTGISGTSFTAAGATGSAFTSSLSRVSLDANTLEVLTDQSPLITVSGSGLTAGLDATVTLQFAKAGSYTTRVPVVDGNFAPYTSITAAPSASESTTPEVTASPESASPSATPTA